jgi:hypothetical protein
MLYTRPPTPQNWGTSEPTPLQSPPILGDLGGGSGRNLCLQTVSYSAAIAKLPGCPKLPVTVSDR